MKVGEALELARVCRQQSQITMDRRTAAVLADLARRYEAIASAMDETHAQTTETPQGRDERHKRKNSTEEGLGGSK